MIKLTAAVLILFLIPLSAMGGPNPDYIIGILNNNIANYKILRSRKELTAQEYYDRTWKSYDKAADDGNMPDLHEMAAFGRVKSQEFLDEKNTEDQYRLAMVEKQEELK